MRALAGWLFTAALAALFACGAFSGCAQSTTTAVYTPVTGIELPASQVAAGHGCGVGPGQVFKYGALVGFAAPDGGMGDEGFFASNVFDCYADGVFSNLPPSDSGSQSFFLPVYAFSRCSFSQFMDGGLACPPGVTTGCPGEQPSLLESAIPSADWATICTATQTQNVTVLASCLPLTATDAGSGCADASGP